MNARVPQSFLNQGKNRRIAFRVGCKVIMILNIGGGASAPPLFPDLRRIEKPPRAVFFLFPRFFLLLAKRRNDDERGFFSKRRLFFLLLFFFSHENCSKILLLLHPISRLFNILSLKNTKEYLDSHRSELSVLEVFFRLKQ